MQSGERLSKTMADDDEDDEDAMTSVWIASKIEAREFIVTAFGSLLSSSSSSHPHGLLVKSITCTDVDDNVVAAKGFVPGIVCT